MNYCDRFGVILYPGRKTIAEYFRLRFRVDIGRERVMVNGTGVLLASPLPFVAREYS
jgi:hypothetical protein